MLASLLGLGLLLAGLFLLGLGVFFFFTLILIPLAIIAGLIGIILLVSGVFALLLRGATHVEHHYTANEHRASHQVISGEVKYCTRCGAPNAKENAFCPNCGNKFLE